MFVEINDTELGKTVSFYVPNITKVVDHGMVDADATGKTQVPMTKIHTVADQVSTFLLPYNDVMGMIKNAILLADL